jgi:predicted PurR-regulated permease PerM
MKKEEANLSIATAIAIRVIAYVLGLWFLFQIRGIIVTIFIAFIFMTAIRPLVTLASRIKIPAIVVIISLFVAFMALAGTLVASLIPSVISESRGLMQNIPRYITSLEDQFGLNLDPNMLNSRFVELPSNILSLAAGAFGNIIIIFAVFFMVYYLIVDHDRLHLSLVRFFGKDNPESKAKTFIHDVELRLGSWVRGQLALMLIVGIMTYLGLLLLGIPYALPLAVLAGILEAVPNLGPTISAIPAVLIGLTISPLIGLGALIMSILIQQLENNLIVPKVMQRATGVRPLITFIVLMIGFTLGGIAGAVLAMPTYLVIQTILRHSELNYQSKKGEL